MHTRIKGILPYRNSFRVVDIFGYSSKGIPGVEIIGLGAQGRSIKEKFIYLSKMLGLKLPIRRFVLCVELSEVGKEISKDEFKWLEFSLLTLFWSLSGHLPINRLDDCVASGQVFVNGVVEHLAISGRAFEELDDSTKYIAPDDMVTPGQLYLLSAESLYEGKSFLRHKKSAPKEAP